MQLLPGARLWRPYSNASWRTAQTASNSLSVPNAARARQTHGERPDWKSLEVRPVLSGRLIIPDIASVSKNPNDGVGGQAYDRRNQHHQQELRHR
jgi:hypothetical protein